MNQINEIRAQLRPHIGWHGARLSFVVLFLVALFRAKTVNPPFVLIKREQRISLKMTLE
jgi:hypothetical protein